MGRGQRKKRSRGARSSSPTTQGGRGGRGRGREGVVDGSDGSEGHGGGGCSPITAGQGGSGVGDCSPPPSGQSGRSATPPSSTTPRSATPPSSATPPRMTTPPSAPTVLGKPPVDTYAARVTTSKEELAAHRFHEFLQTYMGSSLGDPIYVAEVKSMRAKKLWRLQIQFRHLRMFDRQFSHYVCNYKRWIWGWLLSAVRKFFLAHCGDADEMTSDIINNTELEFIGMPSSIESLPKFLARNKDGLSEFMKICYEDRKSVLVSSSIGSHTFLSCVQYLIKNHIQGHSWNGDFTVADWDVIDGCEVELMKPPVPFSLDYGAADLGKIDSELLPHYLKTDKDGNKVAPLYFRELDVDLTVTSTSVKEEDLLWYREYILSYPAFKPPMARIHLIRGLYREMKTYNLSGDPLFKALLTDAKESCYLDWRALITMTKSNVLLGVYWYDVPEADRATTTKFDASLGSLLGFKRNSCEHIEEKSRNKRGKQLMKTSVEAEVFPASKVAKFLPFLIKSLLKKCNMEGCFREVWKRYRDSGFKSELGIRKAMR